MAAQTVADLMTANVVAVPDSTTVYDAARRMRDDDIGDLLVVADRELRGVVTDRDLVVRVLAEQMDPQQTRIGDVCTSSLVSATPETAVDDAVSMMRDAAIRRLPVVDDGRVVGVVSIGDLAQDRDPHSALADISAAPPND